ncbi:MAG: CotH kinase family protein [Limosilactobacillus reuteri]|nr:CotH kinase family protein [Limosilactobacillus reuteri]
MRVTIDLMKKSTQIIDLSNVINPRVGDDDLLLPLHIVYGDNQTDMRGKDVEFLSNDPDKKNIYVAGTCNTNTPGDNLLMGNLTFRFPAGTFQADGTYDPDKTMFRIVDKATNKVISSVNVKITVMKNNIEFDFDPDNTSYDSRLEEMLHGFHDKGQAMLDNIKDLNDQAKSNVSGDTATTAKEAKKQADQNAGDISDLKGEVAGARGRFANMAGREDAQDAAINQKENIANANANYALLQQKDAQQDAIIANKAGKFELETKLAQMDIHPETFANLDALNAKYPNGSSNFCITIDNMHKYVWLNGGWQDEGPFAFNDLAPAEKRELYIKSSDNLLVNPDLNNNAYGWNMTGTWEKDPAHAIENSMAYGCNNQTKPAKASLFYQDNIPVEKRSTISVAVKVMTDSALAAGLQVLFRDANGNVIDGTDQNVVIPATTYNEYQLIEIKNATIPATAVTAAVTVSNSGTGLVIICRPQVDFDSFNLPYSIRDILNRHETPNNILLNPDLNNDAYGWKFDTGWEEDPVHAIGNSMAYGIYLQTKPLHPNVFKQSGISVAGKTVVSAGITVSTDVAPNVGYFQVSFLDGDNNPIQGKKHSIAIPNGANKQLLKLENIAIPPEAKSLVFAIVIENTGVVNICRPQLNFEKRLLYYSLQELSEQSRGEDNALENPNLKFFAYGWNIDARWQEDPAHAIGNSMAYGCYLTEKPQTPALFYQEDISVEKREKVSVGIEVITDNALDASLQVLFRDANGEIISGTDQSVLLPQNTSKYQTVKIENITVPQNAISAAVTIAMIDKGLVVFCRPRFNYGEQLVPFSLSELNLTDLTTSSGLPFFKFTTALGNVGNDWLKTQFSFVNGSQKIKGYAQIAIQGDSSRLYDKKNYKIKIFSDADCKQKLKLKLMPTWPATNKFNLKANFIDATQSRNLASAKLVAAATAITPIADKTVESHLAKTSNFGQMEGFPIEVWFNDVYNGLYTCNTKKDDKVFGLDADEPGNAAVSVLDNVAQSDTQLLSVPTAKLDGVAYADELHDTPDPELVANWTKWLQFLNTATDDDFKANLGNYIDIKSAINLYLFGVMSREYDYYSKSVLYLTWNNGKYFYLIPYDLDSNWGQTADGQIEGNPAEDGNWGFATETSTKTDGKFVNNVGWNKLFERLYKLFMPEIKEQYTYLRSNVWRTDQLLNAYRDFMNQIPQSVYEKDHKLWAQIPSLKTNDYEQLHQVIVQRSNQMDRWIKSK